MCRSQAWDAKIVTSAWWVHASQVGGRMCLLLLLLLSDLLERQALADKLLCWLVFWPAGEEGFAVVRVLFCCSCTSLR